MTKRKLTKRLARRDTPPKPRTSDEKVFVAMSELGQAALGERVPTLLTPRPARQRFPASTPAGAGPPRLTTKQFDEWLAEWENACILRFKEPMAFDQAKRRFRMRVLEAANGHL